MTGTEVEIEADVSPAEEAAARNGSVAEVDVVILTWNDGELLDKAIASALVSDGVSVNVIVVDNGSVPAARVPPGVTLLRNESNVGVAAGRNQGIAAGGAPVVCLLDSDAELTPGALARMVSELKHRRAAMIVPVFADQRPEDSAGRAPTLSRKVARVLGRTASYQPGPIDGDGDRQVEFGIGACQVFGRHRWAAVGGIDETFFYGPEDVDFCLRLIEAGGSIFQIEGAPVIHPPRRRHRRPLNAAGLKHTVAVARYLHRHRRSLRRRADPSVRVTGRPRWFVVTGPGRSGSTFLDGMLAERGVVAVGELVHLWHRVGIENQRCGCGARSQDCPFWSAVLHDALGPGWRTACVHLDDVYGRFGTYRSWPLMTLAPRRWAVGAQDLIDATGAVAEAIRNRVGPDATVWDSSKAAVQVRLLAAAGLDPTVVVLTRHPAAVAYSWANPKARVEADGRPMPRHGVVGSSLRWSFAVLSGLLEARRGDRPARHLTYERLGEGCPDLIADLNTVGDEPPRWEHAIGGNPVRWSSGGAGFSADDRWRRAGSRPGRYLRRVVANVIAAPGSVALRVGTRFGWCTSG